MFRIFAPLALLATTACTQLPAGSAPDDAAASPPPDATAAEVLGAFGGGAARPAFPGATRPVIVRRLPEGDTWRVSTADPLTGACCNSMTIEQYSERYRGQ